MTQIDIYKKREWRKVIKKVRIGDVLWTLADVHERFHVYEDAQLLQMHTVTHMHPILIGPMCNSSSVEGIARRQGPVFLERPEGFRAIHEPSPQVAGPLADPDEVRALNDFEIRRLEKQVKRQVEQRYGKKKAYRHIARELEAVA